MRIMSIGLEKLVGIRFSVSSAAKRTNQQCPNSVTFYISHSFRVNIMRRRFDFLGMHHDKIVIKLLDGIRNCENISSGTRAELDDEMVNQFDKEIAIDTFEILLIARNTGWGESLSDVSVLLDFFNEYRDAVLGGGVFEDVVHAALAGTSSFVAGFRAVLVED